MNSSPQSQSSRLLSLAAGVSPELAADPCRFLEAAAQAGWSAAGVWHDPASWSDATTTAVARTLESTGLTAVDMEVIRMGPDGDTGEQVVDAAGQLGARNILTISSFEDPAATAERLDELCRRARPAGIRVCIEFMRFTTVRSLSDALDVVAMVEAENVGILVDLLHVARSGTTFDEIEAADPGLFPYVQWCDGPAEPAGWSTRELITDAVDDRSNPGEGELDAEGFEALFDISVPFSLEIRSKALRERFPDHVERAADVLLATEACLGRR